MNLKNTFFSKKKQQQHEKYHHYFKIIYVRECMSELYDCIVYMQFYKIYTLKCIFGFLMLYKLKARKNI